MTIQDALCTKMTAATSTTTVQRADRLRPALTDDSDDVDDDDDDINDERPLATW
jgi:hypothetical protein